MVGLDAAGKTTILYKLKLGEIVTTIPTIGAPFGVSKDSFVSMPFLNRIQCGDCGVQEHIIYRLGCWRSGQDQAAMEALLPGWAAMHSIRLSAKFADT